MFNLWSPTGITKTTKIRVSITLLVCLHSCLNSISFSFFKTDSSQRSLQWVFLDSKWTGRQDGIKKSLFLVPKLEEKKKRRENNARFSLKNSFLFLLKQKIKKKTTRSALSWPILLAYLFSYPLNWIVTGICSNCSKFSKITCPHTHAYFLYYQL